MYIATITAKGQITIPKTVRDRLNLQAGDKLDFCIEADGSVRLFPIAKKVSDVFGAFAHKATRPVSSEEIDARLSKAFKAGKL